MKKYLLYLLLLLSLPVFTNAQEIDSLKTYKVGVKITPPFIIDSEDGYSGISIDLWKSVADKLGIKYKFYEYDLQNLLEAVKKDEIDIAINPLTVTSRRLRDFDFTQPYYISNLAIAVSTEQQENPIWKLLGNFLSVNFWKAILLLFVIILVFGALLWITERKASDQLADDWTGIGDGIWWSAVTMTTVGYGDKYPVTPWGRVVATIWMFVAIVTISGFTASITSAITVNELEYKIKNLDDLRRVTVGTLAGSSSDEFLTQRGINYLTITDIEEGLEKLKTGEINALVYDQPVLSYAIHTSNSEGMIDILPYKFDTEYYSYALPEGSELVDMIDPLLIAEIESLGWQRILSGYKQYSE